LGRSLLSGGKGDCSIKLVQLSSFSEIKDKNGYFLTLIFHRNKESRSLPFVFYLHHYRYFRGGEGVGPLPSRFISTHRFLTSLLGARYFRGSLLSEFYGTKIQLN